MTRTPFTQTTDQRLNEIARDVRRLHDFTRVLVQVLRRNGALEDADAADLRTMCPHTSERVLL